MSDGSFIGNVCYEIERGFQKHKETMTLHSHYYTAPTRWSLLHTKELSTDTSLYGEMKK